MGLDRRSGHTHPKSNMASLSLEDILEDLSKAPKDDVVFEKCPEDPEKGFF